MIICLRNLEISDLVLFKKWLYTPHVAKWYHDPSDWIDEVEKQDGDFSWIHHYIVSYQEKTIGFCQYYACSDSDELWEGYTALGGTYSIDYMIGEMESLRKGYGRQIIAALKEKIRLHNDAERIVVQPEPDNSASCGLLLSCGFQFDAERGIYVDRISPI